MTRAYAAVDDAFGRVSARLPDPDLPTALGARVPRFVAIDGDVAALGWHADAADVGRVAAAVATLAIPALALAPFSVLVAAILAAYALAAAAAVRWTPRLLRRLHESRLVGAGPGFVARLALRVRIEPSAEAAARFAADGDDALARTLARHVRATRGRPETPLDAVEDALPTPDLRRAVALVATAVETPADERERVLDRALAAARDATERHVRAGTRAVTGPVNALYAFGVVLPLALVGLVPVAPAAGLRIPLALVTVVYDALLPLSLLAGAAWVLAHRPAVFRPGRPAVDAPRRRARALGLGVGAAALAAVGCHLLAVRWALPVTAPACGVGVALAVLARPAVAADERATAVDRGLPDATAVLGRRLAAGAPPEAAVAAAGDSIPGRTGALFAAADRVRRALGRPLNDAFFGPHGALTAAHGARVRDTVRLALDASTAGRAGGRVLASYATALDRVDALEADARADLAGLADTLARTGGLFAPVIAGVTVALAAHVGTLAGPDVAAADTPGVAALGLVAGAYVVWSAVVLTALAVCLDRGVRPAPLAYRVGVALASAGACYASAAAVAALAL